MKSYPSAQEGISHITPFYWGQLERASYLFKHPDFVDEQEWRLVAWVDLNIPDPRSLLPEFFRSGTTLTPYTKFQLFSASHPALHPQGLPLRAVRHGPTSLPGEASGALGCLLTARGYPASYCARRGSDTPARL